MEFDKDFLGALFEQAVGSPRRRQVCDLLTSPQDAGQRALCALLPGTQMPIHRHEATAETVLCLCGKLDVVLYEEGLDEEVLSGAVDAIRHADTLIIGGTSLVVYPAAGLIRYFRGDNLVVINMQPTGADASADLCIAKPIGQVLSEDILLD